MAQFVATKEITINGKTYQRGDAVSVRNLPPGRLEQLVGQRRISEDKVTVKPKERD